MDRSLNLPRIEETMTSRGFTQSSLAAALNLSRASVSKWMTRKSFPRAPELLGMGKVLGLGYADLVLKSAAPEPIVAFRRRANTKTTAAHLGRAREMGRLLEPIVEHLNFDKFIAPGRLKDPVLEYDYIQQLVAGLRKELQLEPFGKVTFGNLIGKFKDMQAVVIPVMWGQKDRHENALHIYLPKSKTTWIYLNLDSQVHDFKFWMAHELGHLLSVTLLEENKSELAEDFADAFAGALLFPQSAAELTFAKYELEKLDWMELIFRTAQEFVISPNSVYIELKNYARARGVTGPEVNEKAFYAQLANFNRQCQSVSWELFDGEIPSADRYIRISEEEFATPFFTALGAYLKGARQSDTVVGSLLDIPLSDAKALRAALVS